jgi:hypothetical protein
MNAVITERIRVDAHHAISMVDLRLIPGEEVEVVVRSAQKTGFLHTAQAMQLDTPSDYSVRYEDQIRGA